MSCNILIAYLLLSFGVGVHIWGFFLFASVSVYGYGSKTFSEKAHKERSLSMQSVTVNPKGSCGVG